MMRRTVGAVFGLAAGASALVGVTMGWTGCLFAVGLFGVTAYVLTVPGTSR